MTFDFLIYYIRILILHNVTDRLYTCTLRKTVHGEEEIEAVVKVLRTSTQMGRNVREMEERIAGLYDKKYGIMVNSGSSALYLAADLLDYEKGAEIITPVLTFSTTVAPQVKKGWVPAFVDVEEGTFNIDANKVEEMITSKTKAMIIPNLIGNLPDWQTLLRKFV